MAVVRFEQVVVERDGRKTLEIPDLILKQNRIGVVGLNGSGKSTLLRLINGLVTPNHGRVLVDDLDTAKEGRAVRRRVGFIFQNPDNQIVYPIVAEDIAFGLRNIGIPKPDLPERSQAALDRLGIGHLAERHSHLLSGGEKQLVALAAVLAMAPATILFDEPTAGLDLRNRNRVRDVIATLPEQAIVATHDLELLSRFERVLVLEDGAVVRDADARTALTYYQDRFQ
ncbi:energy-coupling factor ABC transporter ATP-binding protein [Rhodoligotrophos defluvii]|uniref:energy-coupling factor ABC transporter ATP-binding protein n=1 Tax=Rhodoligotrophos defluvii TaxID=2561934 RepID=UPI0010CA201C|nr:ABC transporter ATP-binding protein [Rhodoligotrophos defluvii]